MMTSRERLLCALDKGKPDRMPVSIHQWQPYHLEKYLGGISDLEAFKYFGMDAQIQYLESVGQFWMAEANFAKLSTDNWIDDAQTISDNPDNRIIHHTVRTPEGTLTYKVVGDRKTSWVTEYLVKRDEDIELVRKYMPVPKLDLKPIIKLYDKIADQGILRGFVWGDQGSCWQHACCLIDVSKLIISCFDKPDWVHEFLAILLEKKIRFIETMKGAKFDLVETGGGASSSTVISPSIHEEFCLPYDRKMHDALHDLDFRITYHTCGGTRGIEELIVANGCDASETLAPSSMGSNQEPWEFAQKVAGRVAMIGGVDQFNVITAGTQEQIRQAVDKLFKTVGAEGGYICSMSDHFFETPVQKLQWFAAAARECVY